jgi:hypothetical protein
VNGHAPNRKITPKKLSEKKLADFFPLCRIYKLKVSRPRSRKVCWQVQTFRFLAKIVFLRNFVRLSAIFGISATDFPAQGDYDGDGRTDFAVFRPSTTPGASAFLVQGSLVGAFGVPFGASRDYPAANYNYH